jgi:hypothetical protein
VVNGPAFSENTGILQNPFLLRSRPQDSSDAQAVTGGWRRRRELGPAPVDRLFYRNL